MKNTITQYAQYFWKLVKNSVTWNAKYKCTNCVFVKVLFYTMDDKNIIKRECTQIYQLCL